MRLDGHRPAAIKTYYNRPVEVMQHLTRRRAKELPLRLTAREVLPPFNYHLAVEHLALHHEAALLHLFAGTPPAFPSRSGCFRPPWRSLQPSFYFGTPGSVPPLEA